MGNYKPLGELIDSVSITHNFQKEKLVFLNTSDVLEGKILIDSYMPVSEMKGQAKKTIQNGDILYSEIRPKNKRYAYVKGLEKPEDYVVSTKLMVLRNKSDDLNNDYLYYYLTNQLTLDYLQSRAENRIGSFPQITFDIIRSLNIRLPSLKDQEIISKVLSDINKKIDLNNKINTELESIAKLIYDYWFVQFDFPDENGKPYKSSGGKMVYNKKLKREIPEEWEVATLSEFADITTGKLDSNAEVTEGEFRFYTCASEPTKTNTFSFDVNAILIAGNNASGNFHLNRFKGKFDAYQRTYVITESKTFYLDYLYQVLKNEMKILKKRGKGSQTKFLTLGMLTDITIYKSSDSVIKNYSNISSKLFERQSVVSIENEELNKLRDWLLPMLMNGQVTVKP